MNVIMTTSPPTSSGVWGVAPVFLSTVSTPLSPAPGFSMALADIRLVLSVMPSSVVVVTSAGVTGRKVTHTPAHRNTLGNRAANGQDFMWDNISPGTHSYGGH